MNDIKSIELVKNVFNVIEKATNVNEIYSLLTNEPELFENKINTLKYPKIEYTLSAIGKIARRINKLQRDFSIDISVQFSSTFCEISQRWAQGASWEDITTNSRVDEGDIVRVLRRTLDLCRQIQI